MKILKTILCAAFTFGFVYAQDLQIQSIAFGAKAGLNISDLRGEFADDISSRALFHLGGFAEVMLSDALGAQAEVIFSAQGGTEDNDFADSKIKINVNYINIPLLGKYQVADGIFVYVGPQFSLRVSAKGIVEEGNFKGELDAKDDTKAIDLGVVAGASIEVIENLILEARANIGLLDIETDAPVFKNTVIQISAGYRLFKQ